MDDMPLGEVLAYLLAQDPDGSRIGTAFRATYDQLYDGQHTGRYRFDQLMKTEKTHFGTLFEINLQREFTFDGGLKLDYVIAGHEVDCKYSATGDWMLPPECLNELCLVGVSDDQESKWSLGIIRASPNNVRRGVNRDKKTGLSKDGKKRISWLFKDATLQPNALLQIASADVARIMAHRSGQARINDLLGTATNMRLSRNIIATVAQQGDYMKRVRSNGGARTILQPEGYLILGGDYLNQRQIGSSQKAVEPRAASERPGSVAHCRRTRKNAQ